MVHIECFTLFSLTNCYSERKKKNVVTEAAATASQGGQRNLKSKDASGRKPTQNPQDDSMAHLVVSQDSAQMSSALLLREVCSM